MSSTERTTTADARDAATIAVAVGVVGVSFGALAPSAGLSPAMTMAMSTLVFAGGAQLAVTGILAAGGGVVAAVVAGLVLNLRHLSFGLALAGTLARGPSRLAAAHVITDESTAFVLARGSGTDRARRAFWLLGIMKYGAWQVGTAAGLLLGTVVPDPTAFGVDAAFPAAMLAMLLPMLRSSDARRVGAGAATVALVTSPFAPAGVPVLAGLAGLALAGDRWPRPPWPTRNRPEEVDQHRSALPGAIRRRSTPGEVSESVDQHRSAVPGANWCRSTSGEVSESVDQHRSALPGANRCRSTPGEAPVPVGLHGSGADGCRSAPSESRAADGGDVTAASGATSFGSAPGGPVSWWRRLRGRARPGSGCSS